MTTTTTESPVKVNIEQLRRIIRTAPVHVPIMVWGAPGVGKSAIIHQTAEEQGAGVVTELLSTKSPEDIEGVPFPKMEGESLYTYFAPPHRFRTLFGDDAAKQYLFMDELNTAKPQVQVVAMRIALDRMIGSQRLSDEVRVVAAGNRKADRAAVSPMPKPLENRFQHYELTVDAELWVKWALAHGIDPTIVAFIRSQPSELMTFDPDLACPSFATPRTYEMLDAHLKEIGWEDETAQLVAAGTIGEGSALKLMAYRRLKNDLPDPRAILRDPKGAPVLDKPDRCYFVLTALVAEVLRDQTEKNLVQSLIYVMRTPAEMGAKYVRDVLTSKSEVRKFVLPAFRQNKELLRLYTDKWRDVLALLEGEAAASPDSGARLAAA